MPGRLLMTERDIVARDSMAGHVAPAGPESESQHDGEHGGCPAECGQGHMEHTEAVLTLPFRHDHFAPERLPRIVRVDA